ncbi:MAG: hypothetical protein WD733_24535 [Bryobacterales bacterium]
MKKSRFHPREDQVAELTRGQSLPLAPLHQEHLKSIATALDRAWNELVAEQHETLRSGSEAELNSLMEIRLNALLERDDLWALVARNVARGKETISFDGSHLEKRPDLSIYLTDRSPSFPLVVECKLIDAQRSKTVNLYCKDGLLRFVRGDYGWAAREAFMLAYVRDESTIATCLKPFLHDCLTKQPDTYLTEALPELVSGSEMHMARSRHNREFRYVGLSHGPGAIGIWHLWVATPTK